MLHRHDATSSKQANCSLETRRHHLVPYCPICIAALQCCNAWDGPEASHSASNFVRAWTCGLAQLVRLDVLQLADLSPAVVQYLISYKGCALASLAVTCRSCSSPPLVDSSQGTTVTGPSYPPEQWEIKPSRVVIDRKPDGSPFKLGSGAQPAQCSNCCGILTHVGVILCRA